jgi:hypothetical protein
MCQYMRIYGIPSVLRGENIEDGSAIEGVTPAALMIRAL